MDQNRIMSGRNKILHQLTKISQMLISYVTSISHSSLARKVKIDIQKVVSVREDQTSLI